MTIVETAAFGDSVSTHRPTPVSQPAESPTRSARSARDRLRRNCDTPRARLMTILVSGCPERGFSGAYGCDQGRVRMFCSVSMSGYGE